jgi:hypothetical protein
MTDTDAPNLSLIRDADLRNKLEYHRNRTGGSGMFSFEAKELIAEQQARDAVAAKRAAELAAMSRDAARRAQSHDLLQTTGEDPQNLRHIHSVLALCGLPYTRQPIEEREYRSKQGRMRLIVNAGELMAPDGEFVKQPLPYGSRARLLLLHLCSEAIRQKSPTIDIEDSLTAFLKKMGFEATGGPRGTLTAFKQQVNALAACKMTIGTTDGNGGPSKTVNTQPFSSLDVWFPQSPEQRMLWPSTITFSRDFFDTLNKHALPVNIHAIRAFQGSPRKIDIYYWLTHRLYGLSAPLAISWDALKEQFGDGYSRERDFRAKFISELKHISEVFPKLPATIGEKGMQLKPADTSVMAIPAPRSTKKSVKP